MELTREMLMIGQSVNGGWSRAQTDLLGVAYPLERGWARRVIGSQITEENYRRFMALKDKHLGPKKLVRAASKMLTRAEGSSGRFRGAQSPLPGNRSVMMYDKANERAEMLVSMFSDENGSGTHTTTCTAQNCTYPNCLCT